MKLSFFHGAALAAALFASGCTVTVNSQQQTAREEKRFAVSGRPDIRLTTFDGSIEVRSWDKPEVVVQIEKQGQTAEAVDALQVTAQQNGNVVELEVKGPAREVHSGFGFHASSSARLIVSVPAHSDVRARSGDGSIRIDGVDGRLELTTADGSIRASDVSGELQVQTDDGSVVVDGATGLIDVHTGDGSVDVRGTLTAARIRTGDGSIACRVDAGSAMSGDWEIMTGDGSVSLSLPRDFNADLDARTSDGRVHADVVTRAEADGENQSSKGSLRTRLGAGGKVLRVRSGDGTIRVKAS